MGPTERLFDDAARVASGALSTLVGIRREMETLVRQQVERMLARFELVSRDEFEAVRAMAETAREEQERLAQRLAEIEALLEAAEARRGTPEPMAPDEGPSAP